MAERLNAKEFGIFREYIEKNCGIYLGEDKAYLIESRLGRLLVELSMPSYEELYRYVYSRNDRLLAERIIDAITTNETMWFRDRVLWLILQNRLLPDYVTMLQNGGKNRIRIWSAACSTGQEPYSLAMTIDRFLKIHGIRDVRLADFEIQASDISGTVLQIARTGRYDSISIMRGLEGIYKEAYFTQEGRTWIIADAIKQAVHFHCFNLQDSFAALGHFDLILIRNVMLYFSNDLKRGVIARTSSILNEGGYMAIGASEILTEYQDRFEQLEMEGGVIYKVKR